MNKFDNLKFKQAWRATGVKDFTGTEYLLTRSERLSIVRVKMNRMYCKLYTNLANQIVRCN